jgi:hypothetical protein
MPTPRRRSTSTPKPAEPRTPAEDVIVLAGPPGRLMTTVTVHNASDDRLVVRQPTLRLEGTAVTGAATAIIAPGATAAVPVAVPLDPSTPPGRLEGEMELGGVSRPVVVEVAPHLSLDLTPSRVLATPGRQELTLVVTNTGNVRMPLSSRAVASTDDGDGEPGPEVALVLEAPVLLEPGQRATLTARLEVPQELEPARRHTATVPVGIADLRVIILPRDTSETKS